MSGYNHFAVENGRPKMQTTASGRHSPEDTVTLLICLPCVHKGDVGLDRLFQNVALAVKLPALPRLGLFRDLGLGLVALLALLVARRKLALLDARAETSGRVEGGNAKSTCTATLDEGALRGQFQRHLAGKVLLFEVFVGADERTDHLPDLAAVQEFA